MTDLNAFLLGALVATCVVAGLFFLRFWRKTSDRLFGLFAAAFLLLGLHWFALLFTHGDEAHHFGSYVLRLAAFLLILIGIVDKNRSKPKV